MRPPIIPSRLFFHVPLTILTLLAVVFTASPAGAQGLDPPGDYDRDGHLNQAEVAARSDSYAPWCIPGVSSIQRFNLDTGMFETAAYQNGQPSGVDFPIVPGEGYFVFMKSDLFEFRP